jgi:quercetin dioxygenase-like cupin family protein
VPTWRMEFDHIDSTQGELPPEYQPHFQGSARLQRFTSPFGERPAVSAVHFEAGSRTRPHLHRSGQVLHVTAGEGIIANHGGRRVVVAGTSSPSSRASGTGTAALRRRP